MKCFFVFGGCPKFPFFDNLAKKRAPKKHYKNRGLSKAFFEKQICVTKRQFLDKKSQIQLFQLSFFLPIFFLFQQQNKKSWNPLFYTVLANLKREFSKFKLKTQKTFFAPFFLKKAIFRQLPDNWAPKKHTMITEQKNRLKPPIYSAKMTLAQLITLTWPS